MVDVRLTFLLLSKKYIFFDSSFYLYARKLFCIYVLLKHFPQPIKMVLYSQGRCEAYDKEQLCNAEQVCQEDYHSLAGYKCNNLGDFSSYEFSILRSVVSLLKLKKKI